MKPNLKQILVFSALLGIIAMAACNAAALQQRPRIYFVNRMFGGYNARTIPPFGVWIKSNHRGNRALLDHELLHWRQYQKLGLMGFYAEYLSQFFTTGYDNMPLEIEARFAENDFCQKNYRECIRSGISITIG